MLSFVFSTILDAFILLSSYLDFCIYYAIQGAAGSMINLANTSFLSQPIIEGFASRIYLVLGIFMIFKLSFNFLQYIVNPDTFTDKEKGIGKLMSRVVITLLLLTMTPTIFKEAMNAQTTIVEAIPRVVLGTSVGTSSMQSMAIGKKLALTTLLNFVDYNTDCTSTTAPTGNSIHPDFTSFSEFVQNIRNTCINSSGKKVYAYTYMPLLSSVVGIILLVILVMYSVDVAIRAIKLGVLQIIAPIPIISYVDPKSSKDGAFSSWLKECISTYIDLFLKLAIFYFIIYLVNGLFDTGIGGIFVYPTDDLAAMTYITIFMILGLFLFMRMAVPFLYKVLGIKKPSGSLGLNAALGMLGAGLGGAGVAGMLAAASSSLDEGATAIADGKAVSGGFGKGKDLAAQFASGDPKAKAKSGFQKFNDLIMSNRAAGLGFTASTVEEAKNAKFAAANAAANAQSLRERFTSGTMTAEDQQKVANMEFYDANNNLLNLTDTEKLDRYVNEMNTNSNKADKYYQDAEKYASVLGVSTSESLAEKFKPNSSFDPVGDKYRAHLDNKARDAQSRNQKKRNNNNDPKYKKYKGFNSNRWNP